MVVGQQELAVWRPIRPAVQLHLVAEGRRQVLDDGLLVDHADGTRLFRRRKGLFQRHFGSILLGLRRGFCADDQAGGAIQFVINALLGKAVVHDYAVPVALFVLREGAPHARRLVRRTDRLGMFGTRAKQDRDPAVVILIDIGKADAFAVRRECEVIVGQQELAVRRPIRPAVQLHLIAEGRRQVFDDGLLVDHADGARLFRRRKGLFQRHFGSLLLGLRRDLIADQCDRMIQHRVITGFVKGGVGDHAVPVAILVLREGATHNIGMIFTERLHIGFVELDQGDHRPLVRLVNISETNALACGTEGEMVVGQQELAVLRPVRSAVQFHRVAVLVGQIGDDALFGDHAFLARYGSDREALGKRTLGSGHGHRHDDGSGPRLRFADLILELRYLLIPFAEFIAVRAILLRSFLFHPMRKDAQADQCGGTEEDQRAEDRIQGDQYADPRRHKVHHGQITHSFLPPCFRRFHLPFSAVRRMLFSGFSTVFQRSR